MCSGRRERVEEAKRVLLASYAAASKGLCLRWVVWARQLAELHESLPYHTLPYPTLP